MTLTPAKMLAGIALILAVASYFIDGPLLLVAVILVCIALLVE